MVRKMETLRQKNREIDGQKERHRDKDRYIDSQEDGDTKEYKKHITKHIRT